MNHMITARETHAASDDRLSRIRALLAQAENLGRRSEEVLDDIAGILGTADPAAIYQKPLG